MLCVCFKAPRTFTPTLLTTFWTHDGRLRDVRYTRRAAHALGAGAWTGGFSAAARRRIQQSAALAQELGNIHSFTAFGVVWTIHRLPPRVGGNRGEQRQQRTAQPPNARQQRSQQRAAAHRARCAKADAYQEGCHPPMAGCRSWEKM